MPDKELLELIKEKKSALGLVLDGDDNAQVYFQKLDQVKKAVSSEHLMIVNKECIWGKEGKNHLLRLITEILKANYDRRDIENLFSETFFRLLREKRGEGPPRPHAYIPK